MSETIQKLEIYSRDLVKDCKDEIIVVDFLSHTRNVKLLNISELIYWNVLSPNVIKNRNAYLCLDFPLLCKYKHQYLFVEDNYIVSDTYERMMLLNKLTNKSTYKKWFINPINLHIGHIVTTPNEEYKCVITDINFNDYLISNEIKDVKITIRIRTSDKEVITKVINYIEEIKILGYQVV